MTEEQRESCPIAIKHGRQVTPTDPEFAEYQHYESGQAETEAAATPGPHSEPWLNVLSYHEPGARPALTEALRHPVIGPRFTGSVVDLGAGTCWATAEVSKLAMVERVVAVDLSEGFLRRVGARMISTLGGSADKIVFLPSNFTDVPEPDGSFQVAMLIASLHHAIAPLRVLLEARRLLATGGMLLVIENPAATLRIEQQRRHSLELTRSTDTTEIAYSRGELHYMLRHAGFDQILWQPVGSFSRNPLKRWARQVLRATGIEHHVLSVPYVIAAVKT